MNPMNQGEKQAGVDAQYHKLLYIWFAMLMSVGSMFFITIMVGISTTDRSGDTFTLMLLGMGALSVVLSFVVKSKIMARAIREQKPVMVGNAIIVALALSESPTLFGMFIYFTRAWHYYYLFFIISVIGVLLHLPRRDQLLAAGYKTQGF